MAAPEADGSLPPPVESDDTAELTELIETLSFEHIKRAATVYNLLVSGASEEIMIDAFTKNIGYFPNPRVLIEVSPSDVRGGNPFFALVIQANYARLLSTMFEYADLVSITEDKGDLVALAANSNAPDTLSVLIEKGARLDWAIPGIAVPPDYADKAAIVVDRRNALHTAIASGHWDMAELLIRKGANVRSGFLMDVANSPKGLPQLADPFFLVAFFMKTQGTRATKTLTGDQFRQRPEHDDCDHRSLRMVEILRQAHGARIEEDIMICDDTLAMAAWANNRALLAALVAICPHSRVLSWAASHLLKSLQQITVHPATVLSISRYCTDPDAVVRDARPRYVPYKDLLGVVRDTTFADPLDSAIRRTKILLDRAQEQTDSDSRSWAVTFSAQHTRLCLLKDERRAAFIARSGEEEAVDAS